MSFAFAAGGIVLQHVKLVGLDKTNEMAGPQNLVRVKATVRVRGLYNPALAAYLFAQAGGNSTLGPVFAPGANAPQTEAAVQWALQQPRKPFAFVAGGVLVLFGPKPVTVSLTGSAAGAVKTTTSVPNPFLSGPANLAAFANSPTNSPRATTPFLGGPANLGAFVNQLNTSPPDPTPIVKQKFGFVDCANGPIATARVVENWGDHTFMVEWEITTWLSDAPAPNAPKGTTVQYPTPPLLAQEYSMVHTVDQDYFTTRHVEGRAIFRSDVLQVLKLYPDQLRYWLGHPVPAGFSRSNIQVRAESDNLTLGYRFTDQQRVLNFDPNRFTRVEVTVSNETETLGLESVLRSGIGAALNTFMPISRIASAAVGWIPWAGGAIGAALGALGAAGIGYLTGKLAGVPVTHWTLQGRFWGHPGRDRKFFEQDAYATFMALMDDYLNGVWGYSTPGTGLAGPEAIVGSVTIPRSVTLTNPLPIGPASIPIPIPFLGGLRVQLGDTRQRQRSDLSGMFTELEYHFVGSRIQTLTMPIPRVFVPDITTPPVRLGASGPPPPPSSVFIDPNIKREGRQILADPMRGTYLELAVANALRDSADLWQQVQAPPVVSDTEVTRKVGGTRALGITLP